MTIEFACPSCGTHFKVRKELAGRSGRCKQCTHRVTIPVAEPDLEEVAGQGRFRLVDVAPLSVEDPRRDLRSGAPVSHSDTNQSSDGKWQRVHPDIETLDVVPITLTKLKAIQQAIADEDFDDESVEEYQLAPIEEQPSPDKDSVRNYIRRQAAEAEKLYGKRWGNALGFLSGISQSAFLANWCFAILVLLGAVSGHTSWAIVGATVIVLVCLMQLAVNAVYVLLLPFAGSPRKGVKLFLPPYPNSQRQQMWKAATGLLTPLLPVVGIVVLFTFAPGLSQGNAADDATLKQRLGAEVDALREGVRGKINQGVDRARSALRDSDQRGVPAHTGQESDSGLQPGQSSSDGEEQ